MPFYSSLANEPKTVLQVEDEKHYTLDYESLKEKGFQMGLAISVEDAILRWLVFQPDVVLLDMGLPLNNQAHNPESFSFSGDREGGLKVLLEVLKIDPTNPAKVILTSNTDLDFLPPKVQQLIDHSLGGKFNLEKVRHSRLLKEVVNSNSPPKRHSYSNLLEIHATEELQKLKESIQELRALNLSLNPEQESNKLELMESARQALENFRTAEIQIQKKRLEEHRLKSQVQQQSQKRPSLLSRCFNFFKP